MHFLARILMTVSVFAVLGGIAACGWGWNEYRIAGNSSPTPVDVDLARLEAGQKVTNNHLKIGPHVACYYGTVCSYNAKKGEIQTDELSPSQSLNYVYYPIISVMNTDVPFPEADEPQPRADPTPKQQFAVLVKTNRFKTYSQVGSLPPVKQVDSIQGVVINQIAAPTAEEKDLIRETFPDLDFDKVLILEDGRQPVSQVLAVWSMLGGGVLVLVGAVGGITALVLLIRKRRR